jgi:hypothetical protein
MISSIGQDEARFMGEFVLLKNYPDAEIISSKIEEGLEINRLGELVTTTTVNIKALLPSSAESITINFTIMN